MVGHVVLDGVSRRLERPRDGAAVHRRRRVFCESVENNHSSVIVTSRIAIVHSFESSSPPSPSFVVARGEVSSGISTVRDPGGPHPIPYHPIDRSFDRSTVVVVPRDERRVRTARTARTGASCGAPPSPPRPVVAVASRRVASRLVSHLVDRTRARSRSPRLARPPPPSSSSVPRRTPTTPARRIARINSPALARARVVVVVVDIARAELRRRAPRPRSSRRAPRERGWGLGFRVYGRSVCIADRRRQTSMARATGVTL